MKTQRSEGEELFVSGYRYNNLGNNSAKEHIKGDMGLHEDEIQE